jgi:hypothetical protein
VKRRSILQSPVVLLVEDEPLVREFEIDVLQDAGFRVLEARSADEAFDMLRGRPDVTFRRAPPSSPSRTGPTIWSSSCKSSCAKRPDGDQFNRADFL